MNPLPANLPPSPETLAARIPEARTSTLALFSGQPAFSVPLHIDRPNIADREGFLTLVSDMLDRRWLSNDGPLVQQFEQMIADYLGVRHCVTICNATVALEIAIRALELKDEV